MKVVFDSRIMLAAFFIPGSFQDRILKSLIKNKFEHITSVPVLREVDKVVSESSERGAEDIAADARRDCPVEKGGKTDKYGNRPGSLRDSIRVAKSKYEDGGHLVVVGGKGPWGDTFYAPFVELGTPGTEYRSGSRSGPRKPIKAHPFLRPAKNKNKRKIRRNFAFDLNRVIDRMNRNSLLIK